MSDNKIDNQVDKIDDKFDKPRVSKPKAAVCIVGGKRVSQPKKRKRRFEKHNTDCSCCN